MVDLLVKHGARMEHERDTGVATTFHHGNPRMVKHLLRAGCNVSNGHSHACALWHMAQETRDHEMLELLTANGFDQKNCLDGCWRKGKYMLEGSPLCLYYVTDKLHDINSRTRKRFRKEY
jgi:hypothetical protein